MSTSPPSHLVIAIDGPAASGKSSVARRLARLLGLAYVNTGAMYRAVTWLAVNRGVPATATAELVQLIAQTEFRCGLDEHQYSNILLDGTNPEPFLNDAAVNANVSQISAIPEVRHRLVALQREYGEQYDLVMEGRDIGSVVFPETPYKFYVDASIEVRAQRRKLQGFVDSVQARDQKDSSRATSPLVIAEGARIIDSSHLTVEGVVGEIIGRLRLAGVPIEEAPFRIRRE